MNVYCLFVCCLICWLVCWFSVFCCICCGFSCVGLGADCFVMIVCGIGGCMRLPLDLVVVMIVWNVRV